VTATVRDFQLQTIHTKSLTKDFVLSYTINDMDSRKNIFLMDESIVFDRQSWVFDQSLPLAMSSDSVISVQSASDASTAFSLSMQEIVPLSNEQATSFSVYSTMQPPNQIEGISGLPLRQGKSLSPWPTQQIQRVARTATATTTTTTTTTTTDYLEYSAVKVWPFDINKVDRAMLPFSYP
jgi:hypothetical protein